MAKKSKKMAFDYTTIKTFEDACIKLGIDPKNIPDVSMIPDEFRTPIIAAYKILIIFKAINNGWVPDWSNWKQYKYYPWYGVSASGFGFSYSYYYYANAGTSVGSRLCTDTSEKAIYIANQFEAEYKEYFLFPEK